MFFAIQHDKGIFSPFYQDTTDSIALAKEKIKKVQLPPTHIVNTAGTLPAVICEVFP